MEDEIELIDYLKVIWKRKILIVAGTLICVLAAGVKIYSTTPLYKASTKILLRQPNFQNFFGHRIDKNLYKIEKLGTYIELFKTEKIVKKVLKTLKLDKNQYNLTVNDIQRTGELKIIKGTDIMRLSVSFENPEIAAEIANSWAREFLKHFSVTLQSKFSDQLRQSLEFKEKELNIIRNKINQYHSDNNGDQNLYIAGLIEQELQSELAIFSLQEVSAKIPGIGEIFQEATVPSHSSTNKVKILSVAFVVGLFLSIFIAFFTEYIQNAIAKQKA